jgi:hypothetical protein
MKKAIKSKKRNKKSNKKQHVEIDMQTANILKTVTDQEAFRFYEAIGKPTGQIAKNLPDFLEKAKTVTPQSIMFHLERKDFRNWIERTLGDTELAKKLGKLPLTNDNDAKTNLCRIVENRIQELTSPSITIKADEKAIALLYSPQ